MSMLQRLYQFRGINRSLQPNGLDASYAYDAVNVDIVGGKLTNKTVGSVRLVTVNDVPAARPIIFYDNVNGNHLILRGKYIDLGKGYLKPAYTLLGDANCDGRVTSADAAAAGSPGNLTPQGFINADCDWDGDVDSHDAELILQHVTKMIDLNPPWDDPTEREVGAFDLDRPWTSHVRALKDVENDEDDVHIKGVGRSYVYAKIDNDDVVIASGMLGGTTDKYYEYRGFLVDGFCSTGVYYLGSETPTPKVHIRKFGSGQFMVKDMEIASVNTDGDGRVTSLVMNYPFDDLTDAEIARAKLDGIFLFDEAIGDSPLEDKIDDAVMWLEVTDVVANSTDAEFVVNTKRSDSEVTTSLYVAIRGQCSDIPVTFMQMHNGRLFAAAHRGNREHPRRLYWSCLPGDGRTIEDWTSTDVSIDTSGGHVDIGDPSDELITGLISLGEQILIFTKTRLWRMYGYSPSTYTLELVGELEGTRISNVVDVNGIVYWLSLSGISYYNGSSIAQINDNGSTKNLLNEFPKHVKEAMMYSTVHAVMFDGSLMFSFDNVNMGNECMVLRYDMRTGNVIRYMIPCDNYLQQFTDSVKGNFGKEDGEVIKYETRYFQSMVHKTWNADTSQYDFTMTMTQWYDWGRAKHGWYDEKKVNSLWQSGWTDFGSPESFKKPVDVYMRGEGNFDLTLESEVNKETVNVTMPDRHAPVRDVSSHVAGGRSFRMTIETDEPFEIEPYMTIKFDSGAIR